MLYFTKGNLLEADVEVLVNTVNCVGYMGKGIAFQFKCSFSENFRAYQKACKSGKIKPGHIFIYETGFLNNPKYIFNFPTKRHWREQSKLEDIQSGLVSLVYWIEQLQIKSIAIPALGCGLGGLPWANVRKLIEQQCIDLKSTDIFIYEPEKFIQTMPANKTKPIMTRARALFIKLMHLYQHDNYPLNLLVIQKLAYFLQESGEPLKLKYEAGHFGPYAHNLNKVLEILENYYIKGFEKTNKPFAPIELIYNAIDDANAFLNLDITAKTRIELVEDLIDGFSTPYGLELLASVHWVAHYKNPPARTQQEAIQLVHTWNTQKKEKFDQEHIICAWDQLKNKNWIHLN